MLDIYQKLKVQLEVEFGNCMRPNTDSVRLRFGDSILSRMCIVDIHNMSSTSLEA